MKHKSLVLACASIAASFALVGCRESAPSQGGVAVLDLDRVAAALGWEQSFNDAMSAKDRTLTSQVEQTKLSLERELKDLQDSYGLEPTDAQRIQLAQFTQQANEQFQGLVNAARQETVTFRTQLINQFRERVRPFAEDVARENGFALMVLRTDPVYVILPEADVTGKVIQAMQGVEVRAEPDKLSTD